MSKIAQTIHKKTSERTCVACGRSDAKNGLVRFVRNREGVVSCDPSGRVSGRGAYLCYDESCFGAAEKRKRLASALKCSLSTEDYRRLEAEFKAHCASQEHLDPRF